MQTFKKILFLLTLQERKYAAILLIMILIMALVDMIGVASILPFITVLINPSLIETNAILNNMFKIANKFGIENNQQFLFSLGASVFMLFIFSLIFKTITSYIQFRFVQMREYSIGKRLIEGYLHQPYAWFLSRHSSDLEKNIFTEVQQVVLGGLSPLMNLIANSSVTICLIALLLFVDLKLAVIASLSLGGSYFFIFYFVRNYLSRAGQKRLINNQLRFAAVSEAFGAAKEVKIGGLEEVYIKSFSKPALIYARTQALAAVISNLPRYILEAVAFGSIILIILFVMSKTGSFNNVLPILSLYVFAGYRLMPALNGIYTSVTQLIFVGPSLSKIYEDVNTLKPFNKNQDEGILVFNKSISLKNVFYNYPNTSRQTLKNINLNIPAKCSVGLVGATGSGKTTTVDIILGLLEVYQGTLEVDGIVITKKNLRSWQRSIGYVPQYIYLADNTIAANIAFGVETKDINQKSVENAAKIANLHKFITDELPQRYQTIIGERGVKLSGGQRQRIGIARALYHKPKVLIFDEATSALDNQTEKAVMEAVYNLSKNITLIIIAHRLSTVEKCDYIFEFEKGEIKKKIFNGKNKLKNIKN
jgi:ABC-type multidrug transport system fused ATPase/permease subunit